MKLEHVEIFNYKSVKHEFIDLNSPQLCLVGKNECGKSSIIQAISHLDLFENPMSNSMLNKASKEYPTGFPTVSGVFKLTETEYDKLLVIIEKQLSPIEQDKLPMLKSEYFVQMKRWGNGLSNISLILTDKKSVALDLLKTVGNIPEFIDEFSRELYPSFEYHFDEELLIAPATADELLVDDNKFTTFKRLLYLGGCEDLTILNNDDIGFVSNYLSKIGDVLTDILAEHYKQDQSINLSIVTAKGDRFNLIIKDSSKLSFSIDERSPGFRYYFSFLINKLYHLSKNPNKNLVLLLDEPGSALHPNGAKDLLKTINTFSADFQVLYTTHNPFLTIRNNVDSLIYVYKNPKDGTKIERKAFKNRYHVLRNELGILLNDSFFIGDTNLVVEGNTEKLVFHRLFQLEKYSHLQWMNIYNADGASNIPQALNYLGENNLDLAGITFLDSDEETISVRSTKPFKRAMLSKKWISMEVNDAFVDSQTRTFEDLFPEHLMILAFNEYCAMCAESGYFDRPYVTLELNDFPSPIITVLETHFYDFINDGKKSKKSMTKQDIMRRVLEKIDVMEEEERNDSLKYCYVLLDKLSVSLNKIQHHVNN